MTSISSSVNTPPLNGGRPSSGGSARYGLPNGHDGSNGASPPMPHIHDLLAAPKDIDPNTSIKRLLEMAEQSLRQAEGSRTFNRPAAALRDFVRASIIAITTITHHQDYINLRDSRSDLSKAHKQLMAKIYDQHSYFEKIKQDIIEDNRRTGVLPAGTLSRSSGLPQNGAEHRPSSSLSTKPVAPLSQDLNNSIDSKLAGVSLKSKPAMKPKPQALHGNAIGGAGGRTSSDASSSASQDLLARLEQLKGPRSSAGTATSPKPRGPRDMPPPNLPKLGLDTSTTPNLPRAPDAIYSPARGSISGEAGGFESSSSAAYSFQRHNSITSTPGALQRQQSNGYFAIPTSSNAAASSSSAPPSKTKPPEGDTITPNDLYRAMKGEGTILVIDVRNRDDFNEGHIMATPIICIEPSILLRSGISATEISESLVLAPGNEQEVFEKRDQFDLVVFYDQSSQQVPKSRWSSDDEALFSLRRALVDLNYDKPLKNPPPKLLYGGLDGWIDLMGPRSLRVIDSSAAKGPRPTRSGAAFMTRRSSKYRPVQLKPNDVAKWKATIHNEEEQAASSPDIVRTTEEFFERFPPISVHQESMTSPSLARRPTYGLSHQNDLTTELPTPPAKPAPAFSRQSHSDVANEPGKQEVAPPVGAATKQWTGRSTKDTETSAIPVTDFRTGLRNPGVWCYANSSLQCLLASPGFGDEMADTKCMDAYRVPRKTEEKIDNPQLLIRIMSNLFHWMSSGKFQVMQAETLMKYSKHVVAQSRGGEKDDSFGGNKQQDADEFVSFVLDQVDDETNIRRDRSFKGDEDQPQGTNQGNLLQSAEAFWDKQLTVSDSIIDKYWRGVEMQTTRCTECNTRTYRFTPFTSLPLQVEATSDISLDQVLRLHMVESPIEGFQCDNCCKRKGAKHRTNAVVQPAFARLPKLLRVGFKCYNDNGYKLNTHIEWDYDNVDFKILISGVDASGKSASNNSTRYQCYGVILHMGHKVTQGHYIAYIRDRRNKRDPNSWLRCNDTHITPMRVKGPNSDVDRDRKNGFLPYVAFFQQKEH